MNNAILLFKEDSKEIVQLIKNKINLLRSPVDLLNEGEVQEIHHTMKKYSEKIDKLKSTFNNPENITNNSNDIDMYNQIVNSYKDTAHIIEKIIQDYKVTSSTRLANEKIHIMDDGRETNSESSEYVNKDKPTVTRVFLNSIITVQQVAELKLKKNLEDEITYICELFNLRQDSAKEQIIIDFYRDIYKFCLKNGFTIEKISTFFSIMYFTFNYAIMNKKITKEKSISVFNDILNYHCINRPPYFYEIFTYDDRTVILEFIKKGFYKNFILYENIFKYNMNINIYSKEMPKIPADLLPGLSHLDTHKIVEIDSLPIMSTLFEKQEVEVKRPETNEEQKDEFEKYKEEEIEHMRRVISSLSKSKAEWESDRLLQQRLKEERMLEYENNEVKTFIDVKVGEIQKETNELFTLVDNRILEQTSNFMTKLHTPAPNKK
jgi:hypothetical protein